MRAEREPNGHAESWQLYEIDRQTDAERNAELQHKLGAAQRDVRLADAEWLPILQTAAKLIEVSAQMIRHPCLPARSPRRVHF